jgi:hypothetical protein
LSYLSCLFCHAGRNLLTKNEQFAWSDDCSQSHVQAATTAMKEPSVAETVQAILDYLRKNPKAQDTLPGIVQWWLTDLPVKPRAATVKQALDKLVRDGCLSENKGKDAQISYRMKTPPP